MKAIRYALKEQFSLFDAAVAGLVVAAGMNHDYWIAGGVFVVGSWLSGFLAAATEAT